MAIGNKNKQKQSLVKLNKLFIDREKLQYDFKKHLSNVNNPDFNGLLLIYSGVGRAGKSSLLNQFETFLSQDEFVHYSFESKKFYDEKVAMVSALKTLRSRLTKQCKIEFPLFDKGCIYLAQKTNEFNSAEQQKVILKNSSTLRAFRNYLESLSQKSVVIAGIAEFVNTFAEDNDAILDLLDEFADTAVAFKAMKVFVGFLDRQITANADSARMAGDTDYAELINELKDLNEQDDDGSRMTEILPKLFAKDLSHWLNTHGAHLIIFLDAYEKLTGEEGGKKNTVRLSENRDVPADLLFKRRSAASTKAGNSWRNAFAFCTAGRISLPPPRLLISTTSPITA